MAKRLSVIMPVYNREQFVMEAIMSILGQTYGDFELLVIDDCSTDKTLENIFSIEDERIRVLQLSTHMNVPELRNYGIENSSGEYIAWMDSDDISLSERLQKQVDFLDSHLDIDIISSRYQLFGGNTKKYELPDNDVELKYTLMFSSAFANPALMFRRRFLERTGIKYDTRFFLCEDYKFYVDGIKSAKFANIPEILLRYRVGHGNITTNSFNDEKQLVKRKKLIDEIHRIAIEQNGFTITREELRIFNLFFGDANRNLPKPTSTEYDVLMQVFKKFKEQAADSNKDVEVLDKVLSVARLKIESKYGEF